MIKQLNELRSEQATVLNQNQALSKEVDKLKHLDQIRTVRVWTQPQANNPPMLNETQTRSFQRPPVVCFNCNKAGHISCNCTEPRRGNAFRNTVSSNDQTTPLHLEGVTKQNRQVGVYSTYVKAMVGNLYCNCLLDTGSEVTIVAARLVKGMTINQTTHTLKAANGTSIPLLREVILPMSIGNFKTTMSGLVSEHIEEVMLGIDWLTINKVVWDFGQLRIQIGSEHFSLKTSTSDVQSCRKVTLQEHVVIPARAEVDLPTRVVCKSWRESESDIQWGT